jgi:hypothetical protein
MDSNGDRMNCPCTQPTGKTGYCAVRKKNLPVHWINLCRENPRYRDSFNDVPVRKGKPPEKGPGTELSKLLNKMGYRPNSTCKCWKHKRTMNEWGPDKCKDNIDTIVEWLKNEAKKQSRMFNRHAAKLLVLIAIRRSRNSCLNKNGHS